MYEIRDRMEMNIKGTAEHLGNIADGKVQMIEEALKTMHTLVAANTERETSISKYLEELQGTRPPGRPGHHRLLPPRRPGARQR